MKKEDSLSMQRLKDKVAKSNAKKLTNSRVNRLVMAKVAKSK